MILIFYMPIPYPFTLKNWKPNTMLLYKVNFPCFIFSLDNLNEWISLQRFNVAWSALFLMGCWVVNLCLYIFKKNFLCMPEHSRVEYENNVVLHHLLPIFHISFTKQFTIRRILTTFDQMHPSYTFGMNIGQKVNL